MEIYNDSYSVYVHTNKINGKLYIGITKQRVSDRWKRGSTYKGNPHFYAAILKYRWDGFEHEVFASGLTEQEAKHMEELLIRELKTQDPKYGYNVTGGGDTPINATQEVRDKISAAVKGEKHPCFGKHLSEETRKKISASEKGTKKPSIAKLKSIPVICVETNQVYPSAKIAAQKTGVERTGITQAAKGHRQTAGGYHWQYYIEIKQTS